MMTYVTRVAHSTTARPNFSILGARGKRRGFSPGATAHPLDRTRVRENFGKKQKKLFTKKKQ